MVVADISVVPLGEREVRPIVSAVVKEIKDSGLTFEVGAMSTAIEGDLDSVLEVAKRAHEAAKKAGAKRVLTTLRIDDREDGVTISGKVKGLR